MNRLEKMGDFFNTRSESYDEVHTSGIDGGIESKKVIVELLPSTTESLLDIGIGTGLELEAIFLRFPNIHVTGMDIAENMLAHLKEKYKKEYDNNQIKLLHRSYVDYDFIEQEYDAVISVMTLHHYSHEIKIGIYRNILNTLKSGGVYIESDYMISELNNTNPQAIEDELFQKLAALISVPNECCENF